MKFYTNVQLIGNQFLVRGVENGKRYEHRDEFFPTLFVKSKKNLKTKYKTLSGESVEEIKPGTVRECRDFYKKYEDVEGFEIYGNDRYIYQYISEKYPDDEIKFDISQIKLVTLDIEVASDTVSQTLNLVLKRSWQSQYRITQLSRSLLGEVNLLLTNRRM